MTDNARKEYLNQFFGSKRYLYQDNERVAHIHVVNGTYYFHGHIVPGWQGVKKTFDTAEEYKATWFGIRGAEATNFILEEMEMMNNREQIEQSIISASAYNGNDTEGLLKEVEDVYKKAQAFDEILDGMTNAIQHSVKEGVELDEAVGIMAGQVVYKYEEEQENEY